MRAAMGSGPARRRPVFAPLTRPCLAHDLSDPPCTTDQLTKALGSTRPDAQAGPNVGAARTAQRRAVLAARKGDLGDH
jgi:hypothetical protein